MAVTAFSGGYQLTAASDALDHATVGMKNAPTGSKFKVRIVGIMLVVGITGGVTTLRADGASGTIIWSGTPTVSATTVIALSAPFEVGDFAVSALGTNVVVVVLVDSGK